MTEGRTTYNSGKPCRRGHTCDRYTSNGCCIECLNVHTVDKRAEFATAKGKRIIALSQSFREHKVMVKQGHIHVVDELGDILRYASAEASDALITKIRAIYLAAPTPRALTRDDLLTFVDFRDNSVHNMAALTIVQESDFDTPCIVFNGLQYDGEHCMEVLRGTKPNVKPKS